MDTGPQRNVLFRPYSRHFCNRWACFCLHGRVARTRIGLYQWLVLLSSAREVSFSFKVRHLFLVLDWQSLMSTGIFMYLPLSYPRYAASLFAANDFFRSIWAAGAVLYATPLFNALGIARAVSLLGGLSCGGVLGVIALYHYGARLRAKSKFAES